MDRRARLDTGKLATALKTGELSLVNDDLKAEMGLNGAKGAQGDQFLDDEEEDDETPEGKPDSNPIVP